MNNIAKRKSEHIEICLQEDVQGERITSGFEKFRFRHQALPEIDFQEIRTETRFLGKKLQAPFLISSMTGGAEKSGVINGNLARLAQSRGWALAVGSLRAAVEHPELAETYDVRTHAPDVPILANLGAVQLNYGFGPEQCLKAVELIEADGLVLHLNSLQEAFQPGGNTNFRGLLGKIKHICSSLSIPVGVKEVGWGIHADTAERLLALGVSLVDVAGAGGTSWSQVERHRGDDPIRRAAAEAFADWGNPTADCVLAIRSRFPDASILASGGLNSGVDAAKAIALGARLCGFGRSLLGSATESIKALDGLAERLELELKTAMFGIGAATLDELRGTPAIGKV